MSATLLLEKMPLNLAGGGALGALLCVTVSLLLAIVGADDPYRFFNWNVTYGDIYPLGVRQQVSDSDLTGFGGILRSVLGSIMSNLNLIKTIQISL